MSSTVTAVSHEIELTSGKVRQRAQFVYDDSSFLIRDSAKSTCIPLTFLSCLRHAQQGKPKIHVPLSHVIWVSKSGLVIEVHVLRRTSWGLKLVNVSGSFQGDDSSSAADDWVRGAMNAAYKGVFAGDTSCFPRINNIRRCQDPAAPSCGHKPYGGLVSHPSILAPTLIR
jgi:hypothetical protein